MPRLLAIDQGTTNTKALLIDESGTTVAAASRPVPIRYPQPGWVEQDAMELWASAVQAAADCLSQAGGAAPSAIGISNQRESAIVWERHTGLPVGPCVSWQCRRTAPFCAWLRSHGCESLLIERSGLGVDPVFTASKLRWLLDQVPDGPRRAAAGEIALGTVDSWLLWKLTGGGVHATDWTNASRTQLLNLRSLDWDADLLGLFGIPRAALPELHASSHIYGESVAGSGLPAGIPIGALAGDSHAALFGHAIFAPGEVKATYGTGSSLMTLTREPVWSPGLSTAIGWSCGGTRYALEGNIFSTGGTMQWLGDFLGLQDAVAGAADLAATVLDTGGVYLVPAFSGLGAPYWNDAARGLLCGLTHATTPAHAARAALESIAYQVADVFTAMELAGGDPIPALWADGGGTRNDMLMQFQADILDREVVRSAGAEVSARGAAWLAGLAAGIWRLDDLAAMRQDGRRFCSAMKQSARERLYGGWKEAVERVTAPAGRRLER